MAKRKKRRRPGAGPPPGQRRPESTEATAKPSGSAKGPKVPAKPGYRGSLIRAALVALLFYPYLVYLAGEEPATALLISLAALVIMIPAGIALDRIRYRIQMRRYRQEVQQPTPE